MKNYKTKEGVIMSTTTIGTKLRDITIWYDILLMAFKTQFQASRATSANNKPLIIREGTT